MLAAKGNVEPHDFPHLQTIISLARSCEADTDSLIGGSIALYRDRCAQQLQNVKATVTDAYIGAAIAFILGVIHIGGEVSQPIEVLGHLMGGTICALFSGIVIAHAVIAPIGGRLSGLYGEETREMEAMRVSLTGSGKDVSFASASFHSLTASSDGRYPARLSLFIGLPVFLAILGLIATMPMENIKERLGLSSDHTIPTPQDGAPYYYQLPEKSVNLDGPGQPIFKFHLSLQFQDFTVVQKLDGRMPEVIDAVQQVVRAMRPEDLRGSEKLSQMRQSLKERINEIIKPQRIDEVLFDEAVVH